MDIEYIELSVCHDCLMYISYDDLPTDTDEDTDKMIISGCKGVMTGGDELGFSYDKCDCCKRPSGGDRYRAFM